MTKGGNWNLGVGFHAGDPEGAGHKDIAFSDIAGGYSRSFYFTPAQGGAAVQFAVYCDGTPTSDTTFPRSELRELADASGALMSFDGSTGTHILSGITRVIHGTSATDQVVIAQMRDGSGDTIQLRVQGADITLNVKGAQVATLISGTYTKGTDITWEIKIVNGALTVTINGVVKYTGTPGFGGGQYFKVGCFAQAAYPGTTGVAASDYFAVELRNLVASHA